MATVVLPFVEEFAALAGAELDAAIAGASGIEGVASGAIKSAANQLIGSAVKSGVEGALDTIFGEGTSKDVENSVTEFGQGFKNFWDQIMGYKGPVNHSQRINVPIPRGPQFEGFSVDQYIKQTAEETKNRLAAGALDKVIEEARKAPKDPKQQGRDIAAYLLELERAKKMNDITSETPENLTTNNPLTNPQVLGNNPHIDVLIKNPELAHAAKTVNDTFTTDAYKESIQTKHLSYEEIYQKYTGKGIFPEAWYEVPGSQVNSIYDKCWSIVNELGEEEVYYSERGNTPTIWGNWVGPNSRNDLRPVPQVLDSYAALHDISYQKKYFDLNGDLEFCSRIQWGLNKMGFVEAGVARFCLSYFWTVGRAVAHMAETVRPSVATFKPTSTVVQGQGLTDDFFNSSFTPVTESSPVPSKVNPDTNNGMDIDPDELFIDGLREVMEAEFASQIKGIVSCPITNNLLGSIIITDIYD